MQEGTYPAGEWLEARETAPNVGLDCTPYLHVGVLASTTVPSSHHHREALETELHVGLDCTLYLQAGVLASDIPPSSHHHREALETVLHVGLDCTPYLHAGVLASTTVPSSHHHREALETALHVGLDCTLYLHAGVLASLLLGFGLDAWIVVGRLLSGAGHMWVVTRGAFAEPCFWEPATGLRYLPTDAHDWPYMSVACVFNHQKLFASCQQDDTAASSSFVLEEPTLWRQLAVEPNDVAGPSWSGIELAAPPYLPSHMQELEARLESVVREHLTTHRHNQLGVPGSTSWDMGLGHLLMPALTAYEYQGEHPSPLCPLLLLPLIRLPLSRVQSRPGLRPFRRRPNEAPISCWESKSSTQPQARPERKRITERPSCGLHGLPVHASGRITAHNPRSVSKAIRNALSRKAIVKALMWEDQVLDILGTASTEAAFAFRAHVVPYPEGIFSIWVMLAVKYKGV
eukprot:gene7054-150_t